MSLVALRMHLLLTLKEGSKYTRVERSGGQKTFFSICSLTRKDVHLFNAQLSYCLTTS